MRKVKKAIAFIIISLIASMQCAVMPASATGTSSSSDSSSSPSSTGSSQSQGSSSSSASSGTQDTPGKAATQIINPNIAWPNAPETIADIAYVINSDTGAVLYAKNEDKRAEPASITKLMTAILAVEKFKGALDTQITVQSSDVKPLQGTGSSLMGAGLKAGEVLSVEQLLDGLLLPSGNDAAMVLARAAAGSVGAFVDQMNAKAKELGLTNTHYDNPHGLHDDLQYTTAKDVYTLAKYAMGIDKLAEIVASPRIVIQSSTTKYTLTNTNKMIQSGTYYNQYIKGIKTGSTTDAGDCLVSYMPNYKGLSYYSVVMNCPQVDKYCTSAFVATKPLYAWATSFTVRNILTKGSLQSKIPIELAWNKSKIQLVAASDFNALIPANTPDGSITVKAVGVPKNIQAPVEKGQKIGRLDVMMGDQKLGSVNLISDETVQRSQPLYFVYIVGVFFSSIWFKLISVILVGLLVLFFVVSFIRSRRRKMLNRKKKTYQLPK